ncbi:MAG: NAD(P)-dependent alcohol dehydrogenase [Acidimicrobiales bacterium]
MDPKTTPATMRAAGAKRYGPIRDVRVTEAAVPEPAVGEVRVCVQAAGVNPADVFVTTGSPWAIRMATGPSRPRRATRGTDVAGVVDSIGSGVSGFAVGDRVFGEGMGSFAEYCTARTGRLAKIPARWSLEEAAAVPMAGTTGHALLRRALPEASGKRLLVIGAGGGIGTFLIQLATHAGAEVVAVCSGAKRDLVLGLGASEAVDYATEDITTHTGRYDAIIDNVAVIRFRDLIPLLAKGGILITNGGTGDADGGPFTRPLRATLLHTFLRRPVQVAVCSVRTADLEHLARLGTEGHLSPVVGSTYPLNAIADALQEVADGHARGKVVVQVRS